MNKTNPLIHPSSFCLHPLSYPIFATSECGRGITCTLTTSPTRPPASAPASTAARTAATSPRSVIATSPLPTLCCSTNVTLAALSAASHASTAATMPLVSINPIASPFAMKGSSLIRLLVRVEYRDRLTRDDQFFVRRDDPDFRVRFDAADLLFLRPHLVLAVIQNDAGPFEVATDRFADGDAVLTNAAGEGEDVTAAQRDQIRSDETADAFDERVNGEPCPRASARG